VIPWTERQEKEAATYQINRDPRDIKAKSGGVEEDGAVEGTKADEAGFGQRVKTGSGSQGVCKSGEGGGGLVYEMNVRRNMMCACVSTAGHQ
jgi:hypothetical protein